MRKWLLCISLSTFLTPALWASESFRQTQPKGQEKRPFQLPKPESFKLKNGLMVHLLRDNKLPIVSLDLTFQNGSLSDPIGMAGRADVCMTMLTRGTKKQDKIALNERLADLGAKIYSYASSETQGISARVLSKNYAATAKLMQTMLEEPYLRKKEFKRLINSKLAQLKQAKGSPASLARRLENSILYGKNHPIGQVTTQKGYKKMSVADCKSYLKSTTSPASAALFITGNITKKKVKETFGQSKKWQGQAVILKALEEPKTPKGKIFFVDVKGAAQSYVGLRAFGPKRLSKDYFENLLLSKVYGQGFSSRINMNLREDKGYSYGARGGFTYKKHWGAFKAGSRVRGDATYTSILELLKETRDLKTSKKPVTKKELLREKEGAILSLPGKFATSKSSLSMYKSQIHFGLDKNYFND